MINYRLNSVYLLLSGSTRSDPVRVGRHWAQQGDDLKLQVNEPFLTLEKSQQRPQYLLVFLHHP